MCWLSPPCSITTTRNQRSRPILDALMLALASGYGDQNWGWRVAWRGAVSPGSAIRGCVSQHLRVFAAHAHAVASRNAHHSWLMP